MRPFSHESEKINKKPELISFVLRESGKPAIAIYDLCGKKAFEAALPLNHGDGISRFTWDGTDASGLPVPAGTYAIRLQTEYYNKTLIISKLSQ